MTPPPCQAMENHNDESQEDMKPLHGRLRYLMARTEEETREADRLRQKNKRKNRSSEESEIKRKKIKIKERIGL